MYNCASTMNYLKEKQRMCSSYISCYAECSKSDCPLKTTHNGIVLTCKEFELKYPEKAMKIVQKWVDANPHKTILTEFLKHYPNAPLNKAGLPELCASWLGYTKPKQCYVTKGSCKECWNRSLCERNKLN